MTLRSRFFAMTYDRQISRVEKAGLRAHREGLLAGAGVAQGHTPRGSRFSASSTASADRSRSATWPAW
jgi:hypothetical protein